LFLFDTKGTHPGGNGVTFDWNLLQKYDREKPFLLSGGINPDNIDEIIELKKTLPIYGLDINSKFEIAPGHKDVNKVSAFIEKIKAIKEDRELEV
jgi:phosphoribosylanthranilate isomerase